jgi:hypothetical protein
MPFSPAQNERLFLLTSVSLDAGAADREFTFRVPFGCTVVALEAAADAADATNKVTPSLRRGTTDIVLASAVTSADTVVRKTTPEPNQSLNLDGGETLKIALVFGGTPASVKGINVVVWATPRVY